MRPRFASLFEHGDSLRLADELEQRTAAQQEKEELLDREEELNTIIQRLKDTLSSRQPSPEREPRNCTRNCSSR